MKVAVFWLGAIGGEHGTENHERHEIHESTGDLVFVCFVCFVDHKVPRAVVPGGANPGGSMGWRRCGPLPARGGHSVGMRGGRMGWGTTKDTKDTKVRGIWFWCVSCVSWITKSPARLCRWWESGRGRWGGVGALRRRDEAGIRLGCAGEGIESWLR